MYKLGILCAYTNSVYQASPRGGGRGLGTRLVETILYYTYSTKFEHDVF